MSALHVGFDIGGTNARMALYDGSMTLAAYEKRRIRGQCSPEDLAATISEMVRAHVPVDSVVTIGIGLAAQLDRTGELVINAPNLGWRDVTFAEQVRDALDDLQIARVRVVNDLSALVWGERTAGAAQGIDDVLAVYVGTGVGGAIVAGGKLLDGAGGKSGEIGHAKVVVGGRLCGCGERGCVEAYAGGRHLEEQVLDLAQNLPGEGETNLSVADQMARDGDENLRALWERVTDYLALTTANAVTLLNPEVLLLGGGVLSNLEFFRELTLRKISPLVLAAAREDLELRFGELEDDAGILGAAALAMETL